MVKKVRITLSKKQMQAIQVLRDDSTTELFYGGAAGGGKSWLGVLWLTLNSLEYPGTRWMMGRSKLKILKETTLLSFFEVAKLVGMHRDKDYKYNSMSGVITFTNGSEIYLKDLFLYPSDPEFDSLGSTEYTGAFIDEASEVTTKAKTIVTSRLRFKLEEYNLIPKLLLTSNPSKNFLYTQFYKPNKAGTILHYRKFISALVQDNPYISPHYIENLKKLDPVSKERLFYGNFEYDDDPAKLMEYDNIVDIFTNQFVEEEDDTKYISCDVARFGKDKAVIMIWKGLFIEKIYDYGKCSIKELHDNLIRSCKKHKVPFSNVVVDDDGVGCVTPDTEVWTVKGWKKAEDVQEGEQIYSKDENDNLIIETVKSNRKIENMKILKNEDYEYSWTHLMPYKTRKEHSMKVGTWQDTLKLKQIYLDNKFNWTGKADENITFPATEYAMPNGGIKQLDNELNLTKSAFAKFLGWYVSEGCIDDRYVLISQNVDSPHNKMIKSILDECGFNYYIKPKGREQFYSIGHKGLVKWLKEHCYVGKTYNCYNKKTPDLIKNSTKRIIDLYLDEFINGDGYYHKGMRTMITSSPVLADDLHELLLKSGSYANKRIKHKKGSTSVIEGRTLTRTTDCFVVYEWSNKHILHNVCETEERIGTVHNIKITGKTHLFMNRFKNNRVFWTHNGGIVDWLPNVTGFVNNGKVIDEDNQTLNYANLKTQCYFKLAEYVMANKIGCYKEVPVEIQENIIAELEQVKRADIDNDQKVKLVKKEVMKDNLEGRSPDYADSMMMRMVFEVKQEVLMDYLEL